MCNLIARWNYVRHVKNIKVGNGFCCIGGGNINHLDFVKKWVYYGGYEVFKSFLYNNYYNPVGGVISVCGKTRIFL